jgi:hypothetical protein
MPKITVWVLTIGETTLGEFPHEGNAHAAKATLNEVLGRSIVNSKVRATVQTVTRQAPLPTETGSVIRITEVDGSSVENVDGGIVAVRRDTGVWALSRGNGRYGYILDCSHIITDWEVY